MRYLLLALCLLIICSCKEQTKTETLTGEIIQLTEETLPPMKEFYSERLRFPHEEMFNVPYTFVYHDTIVALFERQNFDSHFIYVINLNTGKIYGEYFKKGNGPGELMRPSFDIRNNHLFVHDPHLWAVARMSIDSIIEKGNDYKVEPKFVKSWDAILDNDMPNDTTLVAIDPYYIHDGRYEQGISQLFKVDLRTGERVVPFEPDNDMKFSDRIFGGFILHFDDKLFYAYKYKPIISFLDSNYEPIRTYVGPEPDDLKYKEVGDQSTLEHDADGYYMYSSGLEESENYIFIINYRYHNKEELSLRGCDTEIWQFEKSTMDFVARYHPNVNYEINTLSYSEATNTFYFNLAKDEFELHKSVWEEPEYEEEEE